MDSVNLRNLEQIQETDGRRRTTGLGAWLLAALGGAALAVTALVMMQPSSGPRDNPADPLADLVREARSNGSTAERLEGGEVTFPSTLSDEQRPTTALAAVQDARGHLVDGAAEALVLPPGAPTAPPVASDSLPVVPLPAGTLLQATPVTTEPKDGLTALATEASRVSAGAAMAPAGEDRGFQLQVASFKDQADADQFVEELRRRGHSAFRQAAYVPSRGLWHRVRIGPFESHYEASRYAERLEREERVTPFVVDPSRAQEDREDRERRLAAQRKRDEQRASEQ